MDIKKIETEMQQYATTLISEMQTSDWHTLAEIAKVLIEVGKANGRIFTAGNGGSHATASHMANDFTKGCRVLGRTAFDIECISDANAVTTCLANDFSYSEIFSIPLRTKARAGDAFVYFSGSGNSPNLIEAANTAREMGVITIGFLGRDGGTLKDLSDYHIIAPSCSMERIEDLHMMYEHNMVCAIRSTLEDEWGMEIIRYPSRNTNLRFALFDFDGTLSLIREGWREIMIPYFVEELLQAPNAEDKECIEEMVALFVDRLTGKQTIFQCMRLSEEVIKRGGEKTEPGVYKAEYLRRLGIHIKNRIAELRNGADPENHLVPGSVKLLESLKNRGYKLYLASGTDEEDVLKEAKLLKIDEYFDGHIYGARDDMTDCSKETVIKQLISENNLTGAELVSFGDGFVEIELVADIGGYAIAVATDEVRRKGINSIKRKRLLEAGAALVIPDFSEADKLIEFISIGL